LEEQKFKREYYHRIMKLLQVLLGFVTANEEISNDITNKLRGKFKFQINPSKMFMFWKNKAVR
jgi:hypothetical protein